MMAAITAMSMPSAMATTLQNNFEVKIEGVNDDAIRNELIAVSTLSTRKEKFLSSAVLKRVADRDAEQMQELLKARGYFEAKVAVTIRREGDVAFATFGVDTGPAYTISNYLLEYSDNVTSPRPSSFADADISIPKKFNGVSFAALEKDILAHLQSTGFPLAKTTDRFVRVNAQTKTATAIIVIESGVRAKFGELVIANDIRTSPKYINQMRTWKSGDLYDVETVRTFQAKLARTGLFNSISIAPGPADENGVSNIIVDLDERARRTIGAGISFATDIGFGVRGFWQDRNLLRRNETLTVNAQYSEQERELAVIFSQPLPRVRGSVSAKVDAKQEISAAYEADTIDTGLSFIHGWREEKLKASIGIAYSNSTIADTVGTEEFSLWSLPASLSWNNENDLLNPTTGYRLNFSATPFFGDVVFNRFKLNGATRYLFGKKKKNQLAIRSAFGSITGEDTANIPATERFYAGGGGSVRGYDYKSISPVDINGDPLGGLSLAELNLEYRRELSEKWQVAGFIDAGIVSDSTLPDFSEQPLIGAGIGGRYQIPLGPLRFDIATPVNGRDSDASVQFYIALGQSF